MGWRTLLRPVPKLFYLVCMFWVTAFASRAVASEYHGLVTFGGLPLPGATVTVTQGMKKLTTVSDQGGLYAFADLADGPATIEIEMQCFSTIHAEITVSPTIPPGQWELTLLPLEQITKLSKLPSAPSAPLPS